MLPHSFFVTYVVCVILLLNLCSRNGPTLPVSTQLPLNPQIQHTHTHKGFILEISLFGHPVFHLLSLVALLPWSKPSIVKHDPVAVKVANRCLCTSAVPLAPHSCHSHCFYTINHAPAFQTLPESDFRPLKVGRASIFLGLPSSLSLNFPLWKTG